MRNDAENMWLTAFQEALGSDINKYDFIYEENVEGSFKWSTEVVDNVKEAYGNPEKIKSIIKGCDIVVSGYAPFTEDIMNSSDNLKLIGISRGGPVNVDHTAATKKGIYVLKAVGRNAESVADQTMGLILSEMRHIARNNNEIKNGEYFNKINKIGRSTYLDSFNWMEANGKILGLIGYGQVGSRVARRALAFDMNVIVFDPYVDNEFLTREGCKSVELDFLLKNSDFISLHAPLSPETHHMINQKTLSKMKKTAVLINTARGSLIDEKDLYIALKDGIITSAALDVFEQDPIRKDNPLIYLDNVTITPHTAGRSPDTEMRGYKQIAQQVTKFLRGEKIDTLHVSNKDILNESD
jgi:D-3-phosphoglycerate dehydrogenase